MNILRFLTLGDKKLSPFNITHRFTHLFWLGDLNYRVEQPPTVRNPAGSPAGTVHSVAIGVLSSSSLRQHSKKRGDRRARVWPQMRESKEIPFALSKDSWTQECHLAHSAASGSLGSPNLQMFLPTVNKHLSLNGSVQRLPFCSGWWAWNGSNRPSGTGEPS